MIAKEVHRLALARSHVAHPPHVASSRLNCVKDYPSNQSVDHDFPAPASAARLPNAIAESSSKAHAHAHFEVESESRDPSSALRVADRVLAPVAGHALAHRQTRRPDRQGTIRKMKMYDALISIPVSLNDFIQTEFVQSTSRITCVRTVCPRNGLALVTCIAFCD